MQFNYLHCFGVQSTKLKYLNCTSDFVLISRIVLHV